MINELNKYHLHLYIQSNFFDMVILKRNFIFLTWYSFIGQFLHLVGGRGWDIGCG
jgi:hypothetical protein